MAARTKLFGRDAELAALGADLDAARAGAGGLVLVLGEPGIGKTQLALAAASLARARGACAVWGHASQGDGAPVYWPWIRALAAAAAQHPRGSELAPILPILRARDAADPAEGDPARSRFELFDRVTAAMARAAEAQPLVLVFDDLHWADAGSLRLLEFVARALRGLPILVIATARSDEPRDPALARRLAQLGRVARTQRLAGLAPAAVRELLADQLERELTEPDFERVLSVTEGNPFFVIEMAQLLGAPDLRNAVPPGVAELMRRRIEPLPERSLRALEVAAVLGREFELAPLAAALREPPLAVLESLEPALALSLVHVGSGSLRRYAFAHALLRETLYQGLKPARRVQLHAAVAESLESEASADDSERLAALAHHFLEAAEVGDARKAVRYACEAGERALRLCAFDEALRHFEHALAAPLAPADGARLRALLGLGDACHGTGDRARMDGAFREAIELARRDGGERFAAAALRFARARAELGAFDFEVNGLLEQALREIPAEATALRARLLAQLASGLHLLPGEEKRGQELSDEAARLARGLGDEATLTFVLRRRLITLLGPDDLEQRSATADEILARPGLRAAAELESLSARIDACAERGDRPGLDRALAAFAQKVGASRQPFLQWLAATFRTGMALLEGRMADAEAGSQECLEIGRRVQVRSSLLRFAGQQYALRALQGRAGEVGPLLEAGAAETAVVPAWRSVYANYLAVTGRLADAARELDVLAANDFGAIPRGTAWLTAQSLNAMTCWHLFDDRRAGVLYPLLAPYAGRIVVSSPLVSVIQPVDECLGALATLLGRRAEAERHFAAALAQAEVMRARPWQAQIRCEWAGLHLLQSTAPDRARAEALLAEAEAIARPLGVALRRGWIESRLGPEPPAGPSPGRIASLRCEGDVWCVVFEGRTTRVRDVRGFRYLARLLERPNAELHCAELAEVAFDGDAGEQLDPRARAEYGTRLRELREELAEADRNNDRGRLDALHAESEALGAELLRGFGLGGRARRAGNPGERTRIAVTRALRRAIERIAEHDPSLGEHLMRSVRTGAFCCYAPSPRDPVTWS